MNERERAAELRVRQTYAGIPISDEEVRALVEQMPKAEIDEAVAELRSRLAVKHEDPD